MKKNGAAVAAMVLGALFIGSAGYANESEPLTISVLRDGEYTISTQAVPETLPAGLPELPESGPLSSGGAGGDFLGDFNKAKVVIHEVIELGSKLWNFVQENRPVTTIATQAASAVPQGVTHWMQLSGWQTPKSKLFRMTFKNGFGSTVVDLSYRVIFGWGGGLDGKGKFLSDVTVVPADILTSWSYKVDAKSTVASVVNTGSREEPVAGMQLQLDFDVSTPIRQLHITNRYFVRGDGLLVDLDKP